MRQIREQKCNDCRDDHAERVDAPHVALRCQGEKVEDRYDRRYEESDQAGVRHRTQLDFVLGQWPEISGIALSRHDSSRFEHSKLVLRLRYNSLRTMSMNIGIHSICIANGTGGVLWKEP